MLLCFVKLFKFEICLKIIKFLKASKKFKEKFKENLMNFIKDCESFVQFKYNVL